MYIRIKGALDRILAALGLIILAIPLLTVAVCVRLQSKGPAVFRQVRTGLNGKEFRVYKFRTMKATDVPFDIEHPVIDDDNAELTAIGRILRKSKIDEFPQLINVLRGEMSLIGPRPFMPVYYERYEEWEKERLCVKPGLSGLAQVNGNGYLTNEERSYYDIVYARNVSFRADVKIMFKTVGVLLFGEKRFLKNVPASEIEKLKNAAGAAEDER